MCGIAGIYLKNKKAGTDEGISEMANALLLEIESRGPQATGFVSVGWDKSLLLDKSDVRASEFVKTRAAFPKGVQCVLLHTRWATLGKPEVMGNNHPVSANSCFAVHNGHISNHSELFKDEELHRNFEVDSEVIPAILDKYGLDHPDKIREALEKFEGQMAIAAIDPIKCPSRLVLAKGNQSPLYVFENKSVILWASTQLAIKNAWGKVIGTPPRLDKIKAVPFGTFMIADDYGELGKYDYKPKVKSWAGYGTAANNHTSNRYNRHARSRTPAAPRPWDTSGMFTTRNDFDQALSNHRKSAERIARNWGARNSYDDDTDFTDVRGTLKWFTCLCGRSILDEDMITHLKYGKICIDCAHVIAVKYDEVAKKAAAEEAKNREARDTKENPISGITIPSLSEADIKNLESWAFTEARVHRFTLNDLSTETGYSTYALDFLLFRTSHTSTEFSARLLAVKAALRRAYEEIEKKVHENDSLEVSESVDYERKASVSEAQEIAHGMYYPWTAFSETPKGSTETFIKYICEDHAEIFHFGEHCLACQGDDEEIDYTEYAEFTESGSEDKWEKEELSSCGVQAFNGDVNSLEKCEDCGAWNYVDEPCIPCAHEDAKSRSILETAKIKSCCGKNVRGKGCGRKLKLVVENSVVGKRLGYCNPHWTKCSTGKCNADAHYTGLDGARYCHAHSRGKSGVADAAANLGGNTLLIEEVK